MSVNGFLDWLQQSALHWMLKLVERDVVPDFIIRMGIQHLLRTGEAAKMSAPFEQLTEEKSAFVAELKTMPVAVNTQDANEQHYEVPTAYFQHVLGKWMKYSSCLYRSPSDSLDEAEQNMLALYCSRAQLEDGQDVLELGCGWGSVALFVASAYPRSRVTAVSNSRTQKEFIMGKADQLGLTNLQVITANMVDFKAPGTYDRIISVEMLEHMKNYKTLLERCSSWLRPNGLLFVHIFVHRWLCYHFQVRDERDWMSRHFFTGGTMPSYDIFMYFQDHLALQHAWYVNGSHYSRTLEAWLKRQDARRTDIMRIFEDTYGAEQALAWWVRWRLFYLACSELFNYNGGNDWGLGHYLFKKHA